MTLRDDGAAGVDNNTPRSYDDELLDDVRNAVSKNSGAGDAGGDDDDAGAAGAAPEPAPKAKPGDQAGPGEVADRGDGRTPRGQFAKKPPEPAKGKQAAIDGGKAPVAGKDPGKAPAAPGQQQQQPGAKAAAAGDPAAVAAAAAAAGAQPEPKTAPPPGWSIKAKAAWDKLPTEVRADIAKREQEVSSGFQEYSGIKPFAERARASGQTLPQALAAYTGIEDLIRRDIGAGLMHIAQNSGLTQAETGRLFAGLAQRLGFQISTNAPGNQNAPGGSPADQNAGADPTALRQLFEPLLAPVLQKVTALETTLSQRAEGDRTQRLTAAEQVVQSFRSDPEHKFYDNLEEQIFGLLKSGLVKRTGDLAADLKTAYDQACLLHPEIRDALLNERTAALEETRKAEAKKAADKARDASRSINGSPAPGSSEQPARKRGANQSYDDDLYADVQAAVRSSSGRA